MADSFKADSFTADKEKSPEYQTSGFAPGLRIAPINSPEVSREQNTEFANRLPMWGAALGSPFGGPVGGGAGAGLGSLIKQQLQKIAPDVFGQPGGSSVGDFSKDVLINAVLPETLSAAGSGVVRAVANELPGIQKAAGLVTLPLFNRLPATRQAVAQQLTKQAQQQFNARSEQEILTEAAREAALRKQTSLFREPAYGNVPPGRPILQSPRAVETGMELDPVATQQYQAERFGEQAPFQPITIKPEYTTTQPIRFQEGPQAQALPIPKPQLKDFPLPPRPTIIKPDARISNSEATRLNAEAEKNYREALAKRTTDYQNALSQWRLDVKDLNTYTGNLNSQVKSQASAPPRKVPSGDYMVRPEGPVNENWLGENKMGTRLLQLQKDIDAGVDVMKTQNWGEIRRAALSDPTQMHNLKLVAGEKATEGLAFNELFKNQNETLNPKKLFEELKDPIYKKAISPRSREIFEGLLAEIQKQQEGHAVSDTLLRVSKNKLFLGGGLGMAIYRPGVGVPLAIGGAGIQLSNKLVEKLLQSPEAAQMVTKALTTPATAKGADVLGEALTTLLRTVMQPEKEEK